MRTRLGFSAGQLLLAKFDPAMDEQAAKAVIRAVRMWFASGLKAGRVPPCMANRASLKDSLVVLR